MFTTMFKRTAATGAALVAIGSAAAMSVPAIAGAATTHPAVAQSVQAAQHRSHPGYWCWYGYERHWCPPYPRPYPYPYPPRPYPPRCLPYYYWCHPRPCMDECPPYPRRCVDLCPPYPHHWPPGWGPRPMIKVDNH